MILINRCAQFLKSILTLRLALSKRAIAVTVNGKQLWQQLFDRFDDAIRRRPLSFCELPVNRGGGIMSHDVP